MKKTKSAILYSYDDPIRSAYQAKYVTKTLTRFAPQVRLFSYQRAKTFHVGTDEVVILQADDNRRRDGLDEVRMELTARGLLAIDMNVTGRAAGHHWDHSFSAFVIVEDDVTAALRKSFAFARDVFDARDPYKRHDRLLYNVALSGCQHRILVEKPPPAAASPYP